MNDFNKMQIQFIQLIPVLLLVLINITTFSSTVKAQKTTNINLSLIVGEWSEKGKCNSSRYVFTKDGNYQSFFKEKGKWKIFFNGNYTRKNSNSFTITHTDADNNSFEDLLQIYSLGSRTLSGRLFVSTGEDEVETISWQRCSYRR